MLDVGDDCVGIQNVTSDVGDNCVGVCDFMTNVRNSNIRIYCEFGLELDSWYCSYRMQKVRNAR